MNSLESGKFIAQLRKDRQLTQNDLADLLQVTNKAVSRWETGEGFPDIVILPKLAELLHVTIDELLAGKRKEPSIIAPSHKPHLRFDNYYVVTLVGLIGSFILFLGVTYATLRVWLGIVAYFLPALSLLTLFFIQCNSYRYHTDFTNEDRRRIQQYQMLVISLFIGFSMMIFTQLFLLTLLGQGYVNVVISFESYMPNALIMGVSFFAISMMIHVVGFHHTAALQASKKHYRELLALAGLLISIVLFLLAPPSLLFFGAILYAGYVIDRAKKEQRKWYEYGWMLLPYLVIPVLSLPIIPDPNHMISLIASIYLIVLVIGSVILWVINLIAKRHNYYYWVAYQNISLSILSLVLIDSVSIIFFIGIIAALVTLHYVTEKRLLPMRK